MSGPPIAEGKASRPSQRRPALRTAAALGIIVGGAAFVAAAVGVGFAAASLGQQVAATSALASGGQSNQPADLDGFDEDVVIVRFPLDSDFGDEDLLVEMMPTEDRAASAVETAGAGYLDGNEIGGGEFTLYFYGTDSNRIWRIIEPIIADAPLRASRAELFTAIDDPKPRIIELG